MFELFFSDYVLWPNSKCMYFHLCWFYNWTKTTQINFVLKLGILTEPKTMHSMTFVTRKVHLILHTLPFWWIYLMTLAWRNSIEEIFDLSTQSVVCWRNQVTLVNLWTNLLIIYYANDGHIWDLSNWAQCQWHLWMRRHSWVVALQHMCACVVYDVSAFDREFGRVCVCIGAAGIQ